MVHYNNKEFFGPSVTECLPVKKFHCSDARLEETRKEGEDNHAMLKMFWDTRETFGDPMLKAVDRWYKEYKSILGELILYEKRLQSTSTPKFHGQPDAIFTKAIVDKKRTPGNSKLHALQDAGYEILAVENKVIKPVKSYLIIWFDGKEIKMRNVWREDAVGIFRSLVHKKYIEMRLEDYLKS